MQPASEATHFDDEPAPTEDEKVFVFVDSSDEPAPETPAAKSRLRILMLENESGSQLIEAVQKEFGGAQIVRALGVQKALSWNRLYVFDLLLIETPLQAHVEAGLIDAFARRNPAAKIILTGGDGGGEARPGVYKLRTPVNTTELLETIRFCHRQILCPTADSAFSAPLAAQGPPTSVVPLPPAGAGAPPVVSLPPSPPSGVEPKSQKSRLAAKTAAEPEAEDGHFVVVLSRHSPLEVAQLKCLAGATATLAFVRKSGPDGRIWFERGEIVHAEVESKSGFAALVELMSWQGGNIVEVAIPPPDIRTISMPWATLLMQVAHAADHSSQTSEAPAAIHPNG